ncbi:hypothetical protein BC833DRAFT_565395 [Globomyces pollinis-pini]|nr:hypothetical protein BC833DRAFT_565395 [Globomyces pollinis-pini]
MQPECKNLIQFWVWEGLSIIPPCVQKSKKIENITIENITVRNVDLKFSSICYSSLRYSTFDVSKESAICKTYQLIIAEDQPQQRALAKYYMTSVPENLHQFMDYLASIEFINVSSLICQKHLESIQELTHSKGLGIVGIMNMPLVVKVEFENNVDRHHANPNYSINTLYFGITHFVL